MLLWALLIVFVACHHPAAVLLVTSNEHAFGRDNRSTSSLDIAEAGLNAAVVANQGGSRHATTLSEHRHPRPRQVLVHRRPHAGQPERPDQFTWTIASTGALGPIRRHRETKLGQTIDPPARRRPDGHNARLGRLRLRDVPRLRVIGLARRPSTNANTLSASAQDNVSTYVAGSLCISGGGSRSRGAVDERGGTVSLYVGNKLKIDAATPRRSDLSTKKLKQATVVGGCVDGNHESRRRDSRVQQAGHTATSGTGTGLRLGRLGEHLLLDPGTVTEADDRHLTWYSNAKPGPPTGATLDPTHPREPVDLSERQPDGQPAVEPVEVHVDTYSHTSNSTRNTSVGTVDFLQFVNNWNQHDEQLRLPLLQRERQPGRPPRLDVPVGQG